MEKKINIFVIGLSISISHWIQTDIRLLKKYFNVDVMNISGNFKNDIIPDIFKIIGLINVIFIDMFFRIKKCDVVYIVFVDVHSFFAIIFAKLFGKKSIVIIGGHEVCDMPEINYGFQQKSMWIRGWMVRWSLKHADMCIAPSQVYYDMSLKYVNENRLLSLPICTDLKYPEDKSNKHDVILVGTATKFNYLLKGIPTYDYFASLFPGVNFYMIGDFDTETILKYDHIIYLGGLTHDKVIERINECKIYCQLSYTESFGIAVMEAMACGCVPVVTDKGNLKSLVNGSRFAVCSNDTEKLINGIKNILNTPLEDYYEDMSNITKMRIKYMCAERQFGISNLIKGWFK